MNNPQNQPAIPEKVFKVKGPMGKVVEFSESAARHSFYFEPMGRSNAELLSRNIIPQPHLIPDATESSLQLINKWSKKCKSTSIPVYNQIPKDTALLQRDVTFLREEVGGDLPNFMNTARYLGTEELLFITAKYVATMMRGKTTEELAELFPVLAEEVVADEDPNNGHGRKTRKYKKRKRLTARKVRKAQKPLKTIDLTEMSKPNLESIFEFLERSDILQLAKCSPLHQALVSLVGHKVTFASMSVEEKRALSFQETLDIVFLEKNAWPRKWPLISMAFLTVSENPSIYYFTDKVQTIVNTEPTSRRQFLIGIEESVKIGNHTVPVFNSGNQLFRIVTDEPVAHSLEIAKLLMESAQLSRLSISRDYNSTDETFSAALRTLTNWINSTNHQIGDLRLDRSLRPVDYQQIFEEVDLLRGRCSEIEMEHAEQITVNQLLMIDCPMVNVHGTGLSNIDFLVYLQMFLMGAHRRIRKMGIELREPIVPAIIFAEARRPVVFNWITPLHNIALSFLSADGKVVTVEIVSQRKLTLQVDMPQFGEIQQHFDGSFSRVWNPYVLPMAQPNFYF